MTILEELFYGNIGFDGKRYPKDSSFMESVSLREHSREKLTALLNEEGKEFFERYRDAQGEVEEIVRYDTFADALKFGVLLMAEVFAGSGEVTG